MMLSAKIGLGGRTPGFDTLLPAAPFLIVVPDQNLVVQPVHFCRDSLYVLRGDEQALEDVLIEIPELCTHFGIESWN